MKSFSVAACIGIVLVISGCSAQTSPVPDETYSTPVSIANPSGPLTWPGPNGITHQCVDAIGDGMQAPTFDLSTVTLMRQEDWLTAVYEFKTDADYRQTNNLEITLSLAQEPYLSNAVSFDAEIIDNKVHMTVTGSKRAYGSGTESVYNFETSNAPGSVTLKYPTKSLARLGPNFAWRAHVIYNYDGNDECGTTARSLQNENLWFHYVS